MRLNSELSCVLSKRSLVEAGGGLLSVFIKIMLFRSDLGFFLAKIIIFLSEPFC